MSNTTDMNTETETENITTIIKEETGLTIAPPRRKRQLKKAAEPSMKEATELAEGKTLVIKEEEKEPKEEKPNCGAGQPEPNWKQLYLDLKAKTDPLLTKLEQQRQKRNEASKKSKKVSREKDKKVKTELEERVKKLEEKVLEKDFKEVLDEDGDCGHCGDPYAEHGCSAEKCWLFNKCELCDNHDDDINDNAPLCSDCYAEKEARKTRYEKEEQSEEE